MSRQVDDLLDEALSGLRTHAPGRHALAGVAARVCRWRSAEDGTPHVAALIATTDPDASRDAAEKAVAGQDVRRSDYDGVEISVTDGRRGRVRDPRRRRGAGHRRDHREAGDRRRARHAAEPGRRADVHRHPRGPAGRQARRRVRERARAWWSSSAPRPPPRRRSAPAAWRSSTSIESIGMSLSAEPDGIALDLTTNYDTVEAHPGAARRPDGARSRERHHVVRAGRRVRRDRGRAHRRRAAAALDTFEEQTPDGADVIDQAGIREFVEAMTGDIALEVGPGTDGPGLRRAPRRHRRRRRDADLPRRPGDARVAGAGVAGRLAAVASEDLAAQMQACQGTSRQIARCQRETLNEFYSGTGGPGAGRRRSRRRRRPRSTRGSRSPSSRNPRWRQVGRHTRLGGAGRRRGDRDLSGGDPPAHRHEGLGRGRADGERLRLGHRDRADGGERVLPGHPGDRRHRAAEPAARGAGRLRRGRRRRTSRRSPRSWSAGSPTSGARRSGCSCRSDRAKE